MSAPFAPRKGRVSMYGLWQLRDYLMDRGLPTLLVLLLFGYVGIAPAVSSTKFMLDQIMAARPENLARMPDGVKVSELAHAQGLDAAREYMLTTFAQRFLPTFVGVVVFLGALIAISGLVSNDRKNGYYRFLFSKPVMAARYYGQAFAVHWVGFMGIVLLLVLAFSLLVTPLRGAALYEVIAIIYLCYAGILFAISAAARSDWLVMIAFWLFSSFAWDKWGESKSILAKLLYLLPPVHRTSEAYIAAATHVALPWHALEWFAGYGLACVAIALVTLRYRRLALL